MPPGVAPPVLRSAGSSPEPKRVLRMPAVTLDPLREDMLEGLKDALGLLEAFNRLQQEAGAALNAGLTLSNARQVVLEEKEIVTPDDWVRLTPEGDFVDQGSTKSELAVWKGPNGHVRLRELVANPSGPVDGDLIATLPAGYAPSGTIFISGVSTAETPSTVKVQPTGRIEYRSGNTTAFLLLGGAWIAADKSLPPWPTPVRLRLTARGATNARLVLVVARSADGGAGVAHPISCPSPLIEPATQQGEYPTLVLPRIDGLQPLTRYTLTFLVLLE